jgi:hypothetical protein
MAKKILEVSSGDIYNGQKDIGGIIRRHWYLYTLVQIVIFKIQLFFVFINVIFQYFKIWILAITMMLNFVF